MLFSRHTGGWTLSLPVQSVVVFASHGGDEKDLHAPIQSFASLRTGQVVLESLKNERSDGEIARIYGVHPVTLANWKRHFMEHGIEVFGGSDAMKEAERRRAELERLLGQKESVTKRSARR